MAEDFDIFAYDDKVKEKPRVTLEEDSEEDFDVFAYEDKEDKIVEPIPTTDKDKGLKVDEIVANE